MDEDLTTREVALQSGISDDMVRYYYAAGKLRGKKIGGSKRGQFILLFRREDVMEFQGFLSIRDEGLANKVDAGESSIDRG